MHFQHLFLGLITSLFFALSDAEPSHVGLCSNPWSSLRILNLAHTCWLRESRNSLLVQPAEDGKEFEVQNPTELNNFTKAFADAPSHPWSHHPICNSVESAAETKFCVYTSTNFATGRGISIVGTPQTVQAISRNRVFHIPLNQTSKKNTFPPYEVKQLPGRGYGLIANTTVHNGYEIFAHTPIIALQNILDEHLSRDEKFRKELWRLFRIAVEQLPQRTKDMFMALHGEAGGDEIYDRFTTNAFELYDYAAVFPETAVGR
jgi:hypothetical protein